MRRFTARPDLPQETQNRLQEKTREIARHQDPVSRAITVYSSTRSAVWFAPVIASLKLLAGIGERCMLCSGSESSDVEHFKPKAVFPLNAMRWDNFLWSCGICNRNKGNKFPPYSGDGAPLINPLDENVWDFFFIDEYGNLTPIWRPDIEDTDPRARSTVAAFGLDRDALQQSRQGRMRNLKRLITGSLSEFDRGVITDVDLREHIAEWVREPYQPDVADFSFGVRAVVKAPLQKY